MISGPSRGPRNASASHRPTLSKLSSSKRHWKRRVVRTGGTETGTGTGSGVWNRRRELFWAAKCRASERRSRGEPPGRSWRGEEHESWKDEHHLGLANGAEQHGDFCLEKKMVKGRFGGIFMGIGSRWDTWQLYGKKDRIAKVRDSVTSVVLSSRASLFRRTFFFFPSSFSFLLEKFLRKTENDFCWIFCCWAGQAASNIRLILGLAYGLWPKPS